MQWPCVHSSCLQSHAPTLNCKPVTTCSPDVINVMLRCRGGRQIHLLRRKHDGLVSVAHGLHGVLPLPDQHLALVVQFPVIEEFEG